MFAIPYAVRPSLIAGAGKGVFVTADVRAGKVIVAPDQIPGTLSWPEIVALGEQQRAVESSVRWFEDHFTITPDWPDECFINHAFEPTGLWHLGFVFAARDLDAGTELTIDYRYLLHENFQDGFIDSVSGRPVNGIPWNENLRTSTEALLKLL
jgi:hypothetical protein